MALAHLRYASSAIGKQSELYAIIPNRHGPFPVVYQLHGLSDDASAWLRWTTIEREACARGLMVVLLDGGRSFYCDQPLGGMRWEQHILDSIALVDRTFPTRPQRRHRGIGGNSMGGFGAIKLALRYPNRFASAVGHSGAYDTRRLPTADDGQEGLPPHCLVALEPWPDGLGPADDPFSLAQRPGRKPAIQLDCGRTDFLLAHSRRLHRHLIRHGIVHGYREYPGAHDWDYWQARLSAALDFHARHLGARP